MVDCAFPYMKNFCFRKILGIKNHIIIFIWAGFLSWFLFRYLQLGHTAWKTLLNPCFAIIYHYFSNNKTCYACNKICYDCNIICYGTWDQYHIDLNHDWFDSIHWIHWFHWFHPPNPLSQRPHMNFFWTNFESFWRTLDSAFLLIWIRIFFQITITITQAIIITIIYLFLNTYFKEVDTPTFVQENPFY